MCLHEMVNPREELFKHADLHWMEEVGLREVAHNTRQMSKQVESTVNIAQPQFGIGCLGVGIADCSIHVCDPAGGVAWQEGHNVQVRSLDTRTQNRHAARDDVGHYTQSNLEAKLLKPISNSWSCHLHRELTNTDSWRWDIDYKWETGVPAGVTRSAPLGLFAAAYPAASEEYCDSSSELAGEWPLQRCLLRASGGSSKIDWQLPYIQATLSCSQRNWRYVLCRRWRSRETVYWPFWALTQCRLARHHPRVCLLTGVSHHQSAVCLSVKRRICGVSML